VQIDALAIRLRPRTPLEAADLGTRLCQHSARWVYPCYLLVAVPVVALAGGGLALLAVIGALLYFAPGKKGDSARVSVCGIRDSGYH